jgi:Cdc6-like AAA superfamily ATPase
VQHNQEHKAILKWLIPIDYAPQQNDYIRRRQPGTGQWLLDSAEYQAWLRTNKQTLFCPGIPGAGKTMMSSIVVDHLNAKFRNDTAVGIAYIYCSYQPQQEQRAEDLLLSLLGQLAWERPSVPPDVKCLYDHHRTKRSHPSFDEIVRALQSTIQLYSRVFIIIDALDEYYVSNNERQKRLLSAVFGLQDKAQLSLFATSRFISEITSQFRGCIYKEIRAHDDDILSYVNRRIPQLLKSQISKYPQVQEAVRGDVVKAVDGM